MRICIVTDEISADPETAVELGAQWGIRDFELRGYYYDRVPSITDHQKLRLKEVIRQYDARVVAISPGLFKFPLPPTEPESIPLPWLDRVCYDAWEYSKKQTEEHLNELLPATIDFAHEMGAKTIVSFAFSRDGYPAGLAPEPLLEYLFRAAEKVKAAGLQLAIENEFGFWADTGERTAEIVKRVGHPNLGINWDPGNAYCAGDTPFPDGYLSVKDRILHVHFKDVRRVPNGGCEFVEFGEIDWSGQLKALAEDGYQGYISIETHLRPKIAAAKSALDRLKAMIPPVEGSAGKYEWNTT